MRYNDETDQPKNLHAAPTPVVRLLSRYFLDGICKKEHLLAHPLFPNFKYDVCQISFVSKISTCSARCHGCEEESSVEPRGGIQNYVTPYLVLSDNQPPQPQKQSVRLVLPSSIIGIEFRFPPIDKGED